jgi:hypothetical protein
MALVPLLAGQFKVLKHIPFFGILVAVKAPYLGIFGLSKIF